MLNFKKYIVVAFAIVSFTFVFAGGTKDKGKDEGQDNSLQKVQKKGVFVLGLDDSFPPLGFRDKDNTIVGYDIDLAREVCNRLNVTLKLQPIDWAAKEQELNTGKIDCIWNGFTITEERKKVLLFSEPYLDNAQVVIVRLGENIHSLSDLAGKKVGLQAGSSAAIALDSVPNFKSSVTEIVEFKDNLTALMDLEVRGIDAVIMDMVVGNYNIATGGKNFKTLPESLSTEKYGIGFRKNDVELRNAVQKTLEKMASDGTIATIGKKWFGVDISVVGR